MKSWRRGRIFLMALTCVFVISGCNSVSSEGGKGAEAEKISENRGSEGETAAENETAAQGENRAEKEMAAEDETAAENKMAAQGENVKGTNAEAAEGVKREKSGGANKTVRTGQEASERPAVMETNEEINTPHKQEQKTAGADSKEMNILTLDRVLELAEKKTLTWDDFEGYVHEDVGFELMVCIYPTDTNLYVIVGGSGSGEPMYVRLTDEIKGENRESYVEIRTDDVKQFVEEHRKTTVSTGIMAHVKEVHEDGILISSDTDAFPGVFWVRGYEAAAGEECLKGGDYIRILMRDLNRNHTDGIPEYYAEQVLVTDLSEETAQAKVDLLLTDAPPLTLQDALSSRYDPFEIRSGNYSWNVEEDQEGRGKGIVACGAAPLEEAAMKGAARLKLPRYNRMDSVVYTFSTQISPDTLTIRQWDADDIGNPEAMEESVATYYYAPFLLNLKKGNVYEFSATWEKTGGKKNGFYGTASYVLVTE